MGKNDITRGQATINSIPPNQKVSKDAKLTFLSVYIGLMGPKSIIVFVPGYVLPGTGFIDQINHVQAIQFCVIFHRNSEINCKAGAEKASDKKSGARVFWSKDFWPKGTRSMRN